MRYLFLTIALISSIFLFDNTITQAQKSNPSYTVYLPSIQQPNDVIPTTLSQSEQLVLEEINRIRSLSIAEDVNCPALTISPELQMAAYKHSLNMAEANFFQHRDPDGKEVFHRAVEAGYNPMIIGENIAAGYDTAEEVVAAWMASPGHRANILDCSYTETGIGFVFQEDDENNVERSNGQISGPYYSYWTQVFGRR
jgi:uncharacterized protein YkwD